MVNAYEIMLREKYELIFPGTENTLLVKKGTKKPLKRYYKYDDINDTTAYYWTVKGLRVYECYFQAILSH